MDVSSIVASIHSYIIEVRGTNEYIIARNKSTAQNPILYCTLKQINANQTTGCWGEHTSWHVGMQTSADWRGTPSLADSANAVDVMYEEMKYLYKHYLPKVLNE